MNVSVGVVNCQAAFICINTSANSGIKKNLKHRLALNCSLMSRSDILNPRGLPSVFLVSSLRMGRKVGVSAILISSSCELVLIVKNVSR